MSRPKIAVQRFTQIVSHLQKIVWIYTRYEGIFRCFEQALHSSVTHEELIG